MAYNFEDKMLLSFCQVGYIERKVKRKISRKVLHLKDKPTKICYGRSFSDIDTVQTNIFNFIKSGKPFMVGRMGGVESLAALDAIQVTMGLRKEVRPIIAEKAQMNAGFFPATTDKLVLFSELIEESIQQVDVLGSMITNNEGFLLKKNLSKDAIITDIGNLEPYYSNHPWSAALYGKKVLVVYPFADSIIKQYENREHLFPGTDILPEFELHVVKAVQSIAGTKTEFNDWFEALNHMYDDAMKIDFDIALIGCGAYGFPLAAKIKKAGKQAIHLGGAVQILFGIWGSRWDHVEQVKKWKNEYWTRPSIQETPENAKKVENACYW